MVRTRFAPSPTGYLHIGGVRTALFNWLFARKHGGQFLLRIDDTDQQRNVEAALAPILHGFRWLGLDWDEGPEVGGPHAPYYQSQRLPQYQAAVKKLLAAGLAYRDFATAEEVAAERTAAEQEKRPFVYSRKWMAETDAQAASFEGQGRQGVVRLKMPREGTLTIPDLVRGDVQFDWAREQDHVIQRADGTCLYHLASVVDDFDFEISHVIRAEEHLSNTPRQIFIAQSLGYPLPQYAHLPYVAEPGSKNKLSKRKIAQYLKNADFKKVYEHGNAIATALGLTTSADTFNPVIVDFYEQVGYLPDAIINYLLLLGWSLDDRTEFFTREEMIREFSLERVGKSASSFDPKKLWAFQDRYMQLLPAKQKVPKLIPYLQQAGFLSKPVDCEVGPVILKIVEAAGDRIKTYGDILNYTDIFAPDKPVEYDAVAAEKYLRGSKVVDLLTAFRDNVSKLVQFDAKTLRASITDALESILKHSGTSVPIREIGTVAFSNLVDAISRQVDWAATLPFDVANVESSLRKVIDDTGTKIGDIIHSARVAITGKPIGIGLFDHMGLLGKDACIARLKRAIDEARKSATAVVPSEFTKFPIALQPSVAIEPNSNLELWRGDFRLRTDKTEFGGSGRLNVVWLPTPRVELDGTIDGGFELHPNQMELHLVDQNLSVPVFVTSVKHSSSAPTTVTAVTTGALLLGRNEPVDSVKFHITNFHHYRGKAVRSEDGNSCWVARSVFKCEPWEITLDAVFDISEQIAEVRKNGGYAITHVGEIRRIDHRQFALDEASDAISCLHYFLSFCRGFWTAPILLFGSSANSDNVFCSWEPRLFSEWKPLQSWFPQLSLESFESFFPLFFKAWNDTASKKVLQLATYLYLQANASQNAPDIGIVSGYSAIELLTSVQEKDSISGGKHGSRPQIHHAIENYLREIGLDLGIPKELDDLKSFALRNGATTTIQAIKHLRNSHLHPRIQDLNPKDETSAIVAWEGWQTTLWYVELIVLKQLGYRGKYHNRTRREQYVTTSENTPWIEEKST